MRLNSGLLSQNNQVKWGPWILCLLTLIGLALAWGEVFWAPNGYLLSQSGDGVKNIFGFLETIRSDSWSQVNFMGYPYGDHLAYLDSFPLLAYLIKGLKIIGLDLSSHAVGLFNGFIIFGMVPTTLFLYKILRHYGMQVWYSIVMALLIGFMSPQLMRSFGHFALTLPFFVPMLWYLLIRFESKAMSSTIFLFIGLLLCGFTHPYFLALGFFFVALFLISKWKKPTRMELGLFFAALAPLVIYKLFISLGEPAGLRHPYPFGIFTYHSSIESVFLPQRYPIRWPFEKLLNPRPSIWEGTAYLGLVAVAGFVFSCFKIVRNSLKNKKLSFNGNNFPKDLSRYFIVAILTFIFAAAFPIKILPQLVDWIGPLKQFRSLGRFIWIFYYIATIASAIWLWNLSQSFTGQKGKVILILAIGLWWAECFWFVHHELRVPRWNYSYPAQEFLGQEQAFADALNSGGKKSEDFQALLYLPYVHLGSEEIYVERGWNYPMFQSAYASRLPIATYFSSRARIDESYKLLQLMSNPLIQKESFQDSLWDERPLLMVVNNGSTFPDERNLVSRSTFIGAFKDNKLYSIYPHDFSTTYDSAYKEFLSCNPNGLTPDRSNLSDSGQDYVWLDFSEHEGAGLPEESGFPDESGLSSKEKILTLFDGKLTNADTANTYVVSLWAKVIAEHAASPTLHYEQFLEDGSSEVWEISFKDMVDYDRGFVRAEIPFKLKAPGNRLVISYRGKERKVVDQLSIYPAGEKIFGRTRNGKHLKYGDYFIPYPSHLGN